MSSVPRPVRAREVAAALSDAPVEEARGLIERYADDPRAQVRAAVRRARTRVERETAERERVLGMYALEADLASGGTVVGVDEVGRGALAGPLTVAAVQLPPDPIIWGLNDSKQLSPGRREAIAAQIRDVALAVGVAHIEPSDIDHDGMAASLRRAMRQAVEATGLDPDHVLIDGNPVHAHPRETCLVKGDARVASIAAASVVAKVTRDSLMRALDELYPGYHLASCKGYGSAEHIAAIREKGLTPIHRVSFCGHFVEPARLF